MQSLDFPIKFRFRISTLSNDFTAIDQSGNILAYARQKMFKLKEDIEIFTDESRLQLAYRIRADRWLDFSASYAFTDHQDNVLGKVGRKGWKSIWKAQYEIFDRDNNMLYHIREKNPWTKVFDNLLGEIPVLGMATGYLFNPSYIITDLGGQELAELKKEPSMFGRHFTLQKTGHIIPEHQEVIMLGLTMMLLLERRRG
jgi:hypothetical protein